MAEPLRTWLGFDVPGVVVVRTGKVELGQGITTALAQLAADELDVALERIRMVAASTSASPDESYTSGSLSIEQGGAALRTACADARAALVAAAAVALGVDAGDLRVDDGTIIAADGRTTTYWALRWAEALDGAARGAALRSPATFQVAGRAVPRLDLGPKLRGQPSFVHDIREPGMRHARLVRPPTPGSTLLGVDAGAAGAADVVRLGSFLAVVADREWDAVVAAERVMTTATWDVSPLPSPDDLLDRLKAGPCDRWVYEAGEPQGSVGVTLSAAYRRPYLAHGAMGPSCAVARFDGTRLEVRCASQGVFNLRRGLAVALGMEEDDVVVSHVEGPGCYGHNGADDAAFEAALIARARPGEVIRLLWSREEELGWAPFGPMMEVELEVAAGPDGRLARWDATVWSNGHLARPGLVPDRPGFLVGPLLDPPQDRLVAVDGPSLATSGAARNALPPYDVAHLRITSNRFLEMPLRTSALRSLGAFTNVFAAESMMDDLAATLGLDPLEVRLRNLPDPRARAVLRAAADRAGWGAPLDESWGRGLAYARYKGTSGYCAAVAEVEAIDRVRVRRLVLAVDVGTAVNPDGVVNQVEGGAVQAVSWTTTEVVRFDPSGVSSTNWDTYPILRFSDVPEVDVVLLDGAGRPPLGAGEIAQGPVAAAVANALTDALGVRVRELPFRPERIVAAIEASQPAR